jgi:hypothetical protein
VDADGSARAYHPDDPYGEGVCKTSRDRNGELVFKGVCALDNLSSAGFRLFLDTARLRRNPKAGESAANAPDLAAEWKKLWPLVRDRRIKPFNLGAAVGEKAFERYYGFYEKDQSLTALFNKQIIPADEEGYPCRYGADSRHAGYFVAATTLASRNESAKDSCNTSIFVDAERVPFFVLPGGRLGQVGIGDVAIGYLRIGGRERLVFGIAADTGPFDQFGEGSIAFNQRLLGDRKIIMNAKGVNDVDIDLSGVASKEKPTVLAILVLGATKESLKENYSPRNIDAIARREFAKWGGGHAQALERLRSCAELAPVNAQ